MNEPSQSRPAPASHVSDAAARPREPRAPWLVPLGAGIVFGTLMLLVLHRRGLEPWSLLSCYVATIAILSLRLHKTTVAGGDASMPLLALLASIAAGPAGALGVGLLGATRGRRSPSDKLLQAWYERISHATTVDPVARLCENVAAGRTIDLAAAEPASLHALMATGRLEERQTVLGIIARRFHPDYLPVLVLALRSEVPVVRVQAAAVAAHVRPLIAARLAATLVTSRRDHQSPGALLEDLANIEALCASGLLDEGERQRGMAEAQAIKARLATAFRAACRTVLTPPRLPPDSARTTLEQVLIDCGDMAALRSLRSAHRAIHARPTARVRRIAGTAPADARSA
ncbi:MAG: hypothetical protein R3D68_11610 [Hyphomicrobiaceae bacterium]